VAKGKSACKGVLHDLTSIARSNRPFSNSSIRFVSAFNGTDNMPSPDNREQREEEDQADTEPRRVLHDGSKSGTPDLRILHFNDVYHPQQVAHQAIYYLPLITS